MVFLFEFKEINNKKKKFSKKWNLFRKEIEEEIQTTQKKELYSKDGFNFMIKTNRDSDIAFNSKVDMEWRCCHGFWTLLCFLNHKPTH